MSNNNVCEQAPGVATVGAVKSPDELTQIFRARGLKMTPQRQSIFRALHGSGVHPTAEAVYAAVSVEMPTISLRTVYQTLNDLAAMGEIQAIDLGTGSLRFDPNVDPHHHLVCDECGRVSAVQLDSVAALTREIRAQSGFEPVIRHLGIGGLCAECAARSRGERLETDVSGDSHIAGKVLPR